MAGEDCDRGGAYRADGALGKTGLNIMKEWRPL